MVTFRQLNAILNTAWDADFNDKITLQFHEQDGGTSSEVSVFANTWTSRVQLDAPVFTANLPYCLTFKINDMKIMYRILKKGYKNLDCILPLQLTDRGFTVMKGPGKGTVVEVVKK